MLFSHVIGARPNFVKAFPLVNEMKRRGMQCHIVHTGQHYDYEMSGSFFQDLPIPKPDVHLSVGSGSHAQQTAAVLMACERAFSQHKPDAVIVYGDVNSTVAAALAAAKMLIPIIHVESGCRSFDRTMPEEINRVLTDHISSVLFCISDDDVVNLHQEGIIKNVYVSGNLAIDALRFVLESIKHDIQQNQGKEYAVLTLHRPFNVDHCLRLDSILGCINDLGVKVVYPVHPRAGSVVHDLISKYPNIETCKPKGYIDFVKLLAGSSFVITDSGGLQCEASVLNKPCMTLRPSTEHKITITHGTNVLCQSPHDIAESVRTYRRKTCEKPMVWDGQSSQRVVDTLERLYLNNYIG